MSASIFPESIFTGVHDFFHSGTWHALSLGLVALVLLFWLATVYWVNKDARRRIAQPSLVALATLIGANPPFLGSLCGFAEPSCATHHLDPVSSSIAWRP